MAKIKSWKSQLSDGRVFELRSSSKRYPPPCALVINSESSGYHSPVFAPVDQLGIIGGQYRRRHNPGIYVAGIRREEFTGARVARRRRDLERFDADDLALIRYGFALDFSGRISGTYSDMHMPVVVPSDWTVFWLTAFDPNDYRHFELYRWRDELEKLMHGAWHFESSGGSRHLGYKFGHLWATRHDGARLKQIRNLLRARIDGIIEQQVKVARWLDGECVITAEVRRDCPALGCRACYVESPSGTAGIYL